MRLAKYLSTGLAVTAVAAVVAAEPAQVRYPDGYREWAHVKSMLIDEGHALAGLVQGLHHIYANKQAMLGYKNRPFPEGSVIAFDLLTPVAGDKQTTEGARKAVIVMEKNKKKFADTGGWGYEVFGGDSRTDRKVGGGAKQACFGCHTSQKDRDFVFSDWRR